MSELASRAPRKRGSRAAVGLVTAAAAIAITFAPTAASAVGNFNVKLSAASCTEGDYSGSSYTYTVGGAYFAYAVTNYAHPVCINPGNKVPGARAIAGSTVGSWAYGVGTSVTTRIQKANFEQTPYGHHSVGGVHLRNT